MRSRFAAVAAVLLAQTFGSALAGDLPPGLNWTSVYAGLAAGGAWGNVDQTAITPSGLSFRNGDHFNTRDLSGPLGGAVLGADYQVSALVLGFKGSFDLADVSARQLTRSTTVPANNQIAMQRLQWVSLATGRIGFAPTNAWLVYFDGGAAWTRSVRQNNIVSPSNMILSTATGSETVSGWTIGGGVEFRLSQHVSAVIEYSHIDFGTKTISSFGTGVNSIIGGLDAMKLNFTKLGLNFRF